LLDENPDTLAFTDDHLSDAYAVWFGNNRASFYQIQYVPTVQVDGLLQQIGGGYTQYKYMYDTRRAIPTDVTIKAGAVLVSGQTFKVSALVGIESTGIGRTMRMYLAQVLDFYPEGYPQYRNTLMDASFQEPQVALQPGETKRVDWEFSIQEPSWSYKDRVRLIIWAQDPLTYGPAEVFQAAILKWPFKPLVKLGDTNCDGDANFADINPFVLALSNPDEYKKQFPDCDILSADCNQDGDVNFADINPFVVILGGG